MSAQAAARAPNNWAVVAASLDQAWDAWRACEGIARFFSPEAEIGPLVGSAVNIHCKPCGSPAERGADDMREMARPMA